jgi:hypothetical protein
VRLWELVAGPVAGRRRRAAVLVRAGGAGSGEGSMGDAPTADARPLAIAWRTAAGSSGLTAPDPDAA